MATDGIGGVYRNIVFGSACQLPDGQWIEKPDGLRRKIWISL